MISACVFGLLLPQSPDVELSPASSCDHEKLYHTNGHEVDSHLQQVGRKYFCDYILPKITYWARLQSSVDLINLVSDSSVDSPQTIKKRRVKHEPDMQKDVTIHVTNDSLHHLLITVTMFVTLMLRASLSSLQSRSASSSSLVTPQRVASSVPKL